MCVCVEFWLFFTCIGGFLQVLWFLSQPKDCAVGFSMLSIDRFSGVGDGWRGGGMDGWMDIFLIYYF